MNNIKKNINFKQALLLCDKAIEKNPNDANVWGKKGVCLFELGIIEDAIECFDKVIGINPNCVKAWYLKGIALNRSSCNKEALSCISKAVNLFPENKELIVLKGYLIGKSEEKKVKINNIDEWNRIKCPICSGTGIAESFAGFSDSGTHTSSAMCQKCMGTGIKKPNHNQEDQRYW